MPRTRKRRREQSITGYIWFLSAAVVVTFALLIGFQYLNLTRLDREINSLNDQLEERTRLFVEIQQTLGYGGVIHNLKNFIIRRDLRYFQAATGKAGLAREYLEQYKDLPGISDEEAGQVNFILDMVAKYRQVLDYLAEADIAEMSDLELDTLIQVDDSMAEAALENLKASYQEFAARSRAEVLDVIFLSFISLIILVAAGVTVLAILMLLVGLGLRRRMARILSVTTAIGSGDLRELIDMSSRDFVGRMTGNFDSAVSRFRDIAANIRGTVEEGNQNADDLTVRIEETLYAVNRINGSIGELSGMIGRLTARTSESSAAAEEIVATIKSLAGGIENQVSAVTQTSASIEEMAASIRSVASVAESRQKASRDLSQVTDQGESQLETTDGLITGISSSIDDMLEMIDVIESVAS